MKRLIVLETTGSTRKVIYSLSVSLDGFIEDRDGGLGWVTADEEMHAFVSQQEAEIDTHLYGRRMYETMSAFWPTADQDPNNPPYVHEYARIWRGMKKVVFSRTLAQVGAGARLVRGDIAEEVARLKAQPGKHMGIAGAGLAASFAQLGLIDEYQMYVEPVILGGGKPFFAPLDQPERLRLVEARPLQSGIVFLRYQTAAAAP